MYPRHISKPEIMEISEISCLGKGEAEFKVISGIVAQNTKRKVTRWDNWGRNRKRKERGKGERVMKGGREGRRKYLSGYSSKHFHISWF